MKPRGRPPSDRVLFLSASFLEDPKVSVLTDSELRSWLNILLEHVRYGNGSDLPRHAYGVSRRRLDRFTEVGLLDSVGDELHIHEWDSWNGREAYKRFLARERKRRQRRRGGGDE